jgi:aspartate aminotransferase-like enzyme
MGKLFRLGHMGPAQAHPMTLAAQLAVLERALNDIGHPVPFGAGVGAAMAELGGWDDAA